MSVEQPAGPEPDKLGGWEVTRLERVLGAAVRRSCPHWLAADADDIVQAAVVKIVEVLARGEADVSLGSSYLWRVAHSCLVDEIRRRRRRPEVTLDEATAPEQRSHPSAPVDPERRAASAGLAAAIRACLRGLREERRQAVNLYLLGHTVPEIARLAGWATKQADNLVYRGLADLRRCLAGKGVAP